MDNFTKTTFDIVFMILDFFVVVTQSILLITGYTNSIPISIFALAASFISICCISHRYIDDFIQKKKDDKFED